MALEPKVIREELAKIQKLKITGDIISTKNIKKEEQCFNIYESILDDHSTKFKFIYPVLREDCLYDSIFAVLTEPYPVGVHATVTLTEKEPHRLISGRIDSFAEVKTKIAFSYIILIFLAIGTLGLYFKMKSKR